MPGRLQSSVIFFQTPLSQDAQTSYNSEVTRGWFRVVMQFIDSGPCASTFTILIHTIQSSSKSFYNLAKTYNLLKANWECPILLIWSCRWAPTSNHLFLLDVFFQTLRIQFYRISVFFDNSASPAIFLYFPIYVRLMMLSTCDFFRIIIWISCLTVEQVPLHI